ncbi:MAG: Na/Pi cotransporter family protein [Candidatus Faecousia sp.]|nr:Na/Pi cotransporter family protein [Candidatus Faecousia sp.]
MDLFQFLNLLGGLSLFLFGMNVMGQALERRAGSRLRSLLGKMTTNPVAGLLTGLAVTAVIQSSSATTVMVVGFVNSGLMTLRQAINMIMGANIGTTVTAWILSLAGISSSNIFVRLLKPASFTPVVAFVGMIYYMFCKGDKKKDTGLILLGFATLMFGMESMSGAVSGLREVQGFRELFIMFQNPVLGVLAGAVLTAIIQSSSASVGILQALAVTGQVSYGAAIPIIMGQNIGTCVTAMLSAVGANKNAKRAALVHLSFNVIGTAVWLTVFCLVKWLLSPAILNESASLLGIAVAHSVFNVLCTVLMLPLSNVLEKLVCHLVPEGKKPETVMELDERLLATPPVALARCRKVAADMANCAVASMKQGIAALTDYSPALAERVRKAENQTDHFEDILGTYLVKLSTRRISASDSNEAAKLLKIIGDFERIADHAVNLVQSAEELGNKEMALSQEASRELGVLTGAVSEILDLSLEAFLKNDMGPAGMVEPLEQVIDELKEQLRTAHILRLQQEKCSIEAGFIWSDLLTDLERVSDHCSNIAGCVLDMQEGNLNLHESLRAMKEDQEKFADRYLLFRKKYTMEP